MAPRRNNPDKLGLTFTRTNAFQTKGRIFLQASLHFWNKVLAGASLGHIHLVALPKPESISL